VGQQDKGVGRRIKKNLFLRAIISVFIELSMRYIVCGAALLAGIVSKGCFPVLKRNQASGFGVKMSEGS